MYSSVQVVHKIPTGKALTLGFQMDSQDTHMLPVNNMLWFTDWISSLHWKQKYEGVEYNIIKCDCRKAEKDLKRGTLSGKGRSQGRVGKLEWHEKRAIQLIQSTLKVFSQMVGRVSSFYKKDVWTWNLGYSSR